VSDERGPARPNVISDRLVYQGSVADLRVVTIDVGGGKLLEREIVQHAPVAVMVPVDAEGNIIFVRQYRLPAMGVLLEIPAGGIDHGESPENAAQRELREEIGMQARRLTKLGEFYVSPGFLTEYMQLYLAEDLEEAHADADEDEEIEIVRVPLVEAVQMAERGEFRDAKTIAGVLMAARRLGLGEAEAER